MPRSREEILEVFQACAERLGKTPGGETFSKLSGIKPWEVRYYWPTFAALCQEAGLPANEFIKGIPEDQLLESYAKICLRLKRIPFTNEFKIAARESGSFREGSYLRRYGSFRGLQERLKEWIQTDRPDLNEILQYHGWSRGRPKRALHPETVPIDSKPIAFLPLALQQLHWLAQGNRSSIASDENINTVFERRCADAFRCLGFEVIDLGQGRGRKADSLAIARRESFGVIIDAKVRQNGYVLGTEDRKFLEYAVNHTRELHRTGISKVYFVIVGSDFRESHLTQLTNYLAQSPIRSVDFITARALMRIVAESIENRCRFTLVDFDQMLFGNKIIAD